LHPILLEEAVEAQRRALLVLIAVGGSAVLGSYVLAFVYAPAVEADLWGGIPDSWRGFYTVNMFLAAAGFFPATVLLGFKTPLDAFRDQTGVPWDGLIAAYAAILVPSALWLPLLAFYGADPTPMLWLAIRVVLFLVGAGASVVAYMLIRRAAHGPTPAWVAVMMFFFFWLQTMVLDALIWPAYYPA